MCCVTAEQSDTDTNLETHEHDTCGHASFKMVTNQSTKIFYDFTHEIKDAVFVTDFTSHFQTAKFMQINIHSTLYRLYNNCRLSPGEKTANHGVTRMLRSTSGLNIGTTKDNNHDASVTPVGIGSNYTSFSVYIK